MKITAIFLLFVLSLFTIGCGIQNLVSLGHGVAVSNSMTPTINEGDHFGYGALKVSSIEYLERFDIIVFKVSSNTDEQIKQNTQFVFRIIGLEGEKVELKKGKVFINDQLLDEPFEKIESNDDFAPLIIPKGEYFVMGDNRPNSFDSRFWKNKTVKRSDVLGIVSSIIRKEDYEKGKRW